MTSLAVKIDQLAAAVGLKINVDERIADALLESEIANLRAELEAKENNLKHLDEQDEKLTLELKAEEETQEQLIDEAHQFIQNAKNKQQILWTYLATIEHSDDFPINKMKKENDIACQVLWSKLKKIHVRASTVRQQLGELRELQTQCDELKQKANQNDN